MRRAVTDGSPPQKSNARGPYRSSAETRQRLIDAALSLFGGNGFEATSTRDIAARTGVALPAIAYHFGGKEGLYRACAEHVVERYRERMRAGVGTGNLQMPDTPDAARALLRQVTEMLGAMLLDSEQSDAWLTFMIREMNNAGPAHDLLYRDLWEPGLALVATLVAAARGRAAAQGEDKLEALMLLSSFSAFSTSRRVALDFGGWQSIDQPLVSAMLARLEERINAL
ncbi:putative HTH-type transcriptional regulator YbiH [Sphingomonas mucosissima]|uniref:Putative HTH-type transcriptional regulator YbiH n=1 Tax=Sphingomonas mucosissima TaxID=370959 RepID=A0A245ZEM2_9SPHN|nr:putative HTH-type transcriptional regulator YbiH [Sphingomonas mucosissima]